MGNFKDLEIYKMAFDLAIEVHHISLKLPKFEIYEQGSQIRRSSKRIKDTIAEGYGRKKYKDDFIRLLIYAHSSCDETISHLDMITDLYFPNGELKGLIDKYDTLGRKINNFISYVENNWLTPNNSKPETRISNP